MQIARIEPTNNILQMHTVAVGTNAVVRYKTKKMKAKANELIFISQIHRDGSGTSKVPESYLHEMLTNEFMKDEYFTLTCLSLTEKTFIASGFNSFVVQKK